MQYLIHDKTLTDIADAIRAKTGLSEAFAPAEMVDAINGIEQGGTDAEDAIITRTISGEYSNAKATGIGDYAFYSCARLEAVNFPAVSIVSYCAFSYCSNLKTAIFPAATRLDGGAFGYCTSLANVSFPIASSVRNYVFRECYNLSAINFPAATYISANAFNGCRLLSEVVLGASTICTLTDSNAFSSTPFAGYSAYFNGVPVIRVRASLLASYKTATNWTYFSKYMTGYEEELE